jgi:site-specific recombinase XerD
MEGRKMAEKQLTQRQAGLTKAEAGALINDWLKHVEEAEDGSANTITAYQKGLTVFTEWLADNGLTLATVEAPDVVAFKTALKKDYSPQTVNLRLTAVRSFYRWAVNNGLTPINPAREVKGVKRPKSRAHKRGALTNSEVSAVLATCDTGTLEGLRDKAILVLLSHCALRAVEIHRADIGDLTTEDDRLILYVSGKGHTEADEFVVIPLSQEPLIRAWLKHRKTFAAHGLGDPLFISLSNRTRGQRLALRSIRGMIKRRYQQAGVVDNGKRKTTHSLRHSAITNAIRRGATPLQVQGMARHQSFDTTLGYYHETGRLDNPAEDLIDYSNGEQEVTP